MIIEEIVNIVICYNNASEVMEYYKEILSLEEVKNIGYVVVINSASEDEKRELDQFGKDNEHVYIFDPGKNLGYMNGLLFGYRGAIRILRLQIKSLLLSFLTKTMTVM